MARVIENELGELVDYHFKRQAPMLGLWQTLADHFYPERADFLITRGIGDEMADGLLDSYPIQVRRDLANSFQYMLRTDKWFEVGTTVEKVTHQGRAYLQWLTDRQYKIMNDRNAGFMRATKEADNDFACFGNNVVSVERNRKLNGLLYRCWHLRDCTWWEDETGQVCGVMRKWRPPYALLPQYFSDSNLPQALKDKAKQHGGAKFAKSNLVHIEMPMYLFDQDMMDRFKYMRVWFDMETKTIIEKVPSNHKMYCVSRFQTIAGSPFAYSPATVAGLPNARLLQAMTHTLLEAGERIVRPPMAATQNAIRGDVDLGTDGLTWIDDEYDERMGPALRPVLTNTGGFPFGQDMRNDVASALSSAFYINKIALPPVDREMTAYEVSERMKQWRRENLPLFAPVESEYNGQLCEATLNTALVSGFMGDPSMVPEELQGRDTEFKFNSPLSESENEKHATRFQQVSQMLSMAAEHDEAVKENINFDTAFREAVEGMDVPAQWMNSVELVLQRRLARQAEQEAMMTAQLAAQQGEVA